MVRKHKDNITNKKRKTGPALAASVSLNSGAVNAMMSVFAGGWWCGRGNMEKRVMADCHRLPLVRRRTAGRSWVVRGMRTGCHDVTIGGRGKVVVIRGSGRAAIYRVTRIGTKTCGRKFF